MTIRGLCGLIVVVVALVAAGGAHATGGIGDILLLASSDGLEIRKGGIGAVETVAAGGSARVREGDVVTAGRESAFSLMTPEGRVRTETVGPGRPYRVPGSGRPSSVTGNIYASLLQWLNPPPDADPVTLAGLRGGRLKVPLASPHGNRIVADGNSIAIFWTGGEGPVTATLHADTTRLARATGLTGGRAVVGLPGDKLKDGALKAGSYRLVIEDGRDRVEVGLSAYEPSRVPSPRLAASLDGADPAFRFLAATMELATLDHGVWRLEAYRRLVADGSDAALAMAARLAAGYPPPVLD